MGEAPVVVSQSKLGVQADGLVVVLDGTLGLAQLVKGEAPVIIGQGKLRIEPDSLI